MNVELIEEGGEQTWGVVPRMGRVHLSGPGAPETLKGDFEPRVLGGLRNGIRVPEGARWVYLEFVNEGRDLQNEVTDVATLRHLADYVVREAGWIDLNHWSRRAAFPPEWLKQGVSPQDFILGKITELRFSDDDTGYAEAFLWPEGKNRHADIMWDRLCMSPESIHCSVGGPPLERKEEIGADGRKITRLKLLMNHIALCEQAVNPNGTKARTVPFGEFLKAIADGVPSVPDCDGESCVPCWVRGPETHKAVTAGGPSGINAQGVVPQDLEGARKSVGAGEGSVPAEYLSEDGKFKSLEHARRWLTNEMGYPNNQAVKLIKLAAKNRGGGPLKDPLSVAIAGLAAELPKGALDESLKALDETEGEMPPVEPGPLGEGEDLPDGEEGDEDEEGELDPDLDPGAEVGKGAGEATVLEIDDAMLSQLLTQGVVESLKAVVAPLSQKLDAQSAHLAAQDLEIARLKLGVTASIESHKAVAGALDLAQRTAGATPPRAGAAVSSTGAGLRQPRMPMQPPAPAAPAGLTEEESFKAIDAGVPGRVVSMLSHPEIFGNEIEGHTVESVRQTIETAGE